MNKSFNTTGLCIKDRHYMVDTSTIVQNIRTIVDKGEYFVINRARQFGKTTALYYLKQALANDYAVISISLEGIGESAYYNEASFCRSWCKLAATSIKYGKIEGISPEIQKQIQNIGDGKITDVNFLTFSELVTDLCQTSQKPLVLIIDEVDQASGQSVFLDFLGMLRSKYLQRIDLPTFYSVILAGVYDIKNLKLKFRPEGEHQYNSPWNVAVDFNVDMSFHPEDIKKMLMEYEEDHHTGMDLESLADEIYEYTSGYPYLVSRLCQLIDEQIAGTDDYPDKQSAWTPDGFQEAVRRMLRESNTLFDDTLKKLQDYPELKNLIKDILFNGKRYSYESGNFLINLGTMFGFLYEKNGTVLVSTRIFEMKFYNWLLSEEETSNEIYKAGAMEKNQFVINGALQMNLVLQKFMEHFTEIYADNDQHFVEENGRKLFLLYLKPIINGTGNYYIESRTRDMKRTDIIVDYLGKQYVIELKIWHGQEYNHRGEKQLFEYLNYYHQDIGYLLSFNFNKNKQVGMKEINYQGKRIMEVVV